MDDCKVVKNSYGLPFFRLLSVILLFLFSGIFTPVSAQWYWLWNGPQGGSFFNYTEIYFISNEIGLLADGNNLFRTVNGGITWASVNPSWFNDFIHNIEFYDDQTGMVAAGGCLYRTTDGGLNWDYTYPFTGDQYYDVCYIDRFKAVAVGKYGKIIKTEDGGNTWTYKFYGNITYTLNAVSFADHNKGIAVGPNLIMKTTNGGTSWSEHTSTESFSDICFVSPTRGTAVGSSILLTTDAGESWSTKLTGHPMAAVAFYDTCFGWAAGNNGKIYRTTNGGDSWFSQQTWTTHHFTSICTPGRDTGYACGDDRLLMATKNGGIPVELTSFEVITEGKYAKLNWSTATEVNNRGFEIERKNNDSWRTLAFVSGHGTTSEKHNYSYSDNLSDLEGVSSVWYRLKQVDYDGSFEYSKEIEVTFAPDYSLDQNYPNPFNPSTTISYSIPAQGKVRLIVYDALGREVRKLVDEEKDAGNYKVEFNANGLSSGMYFYRLSAGERVISKKMILLK